MKVSILFLLDSRNSFLDLGGEGRNNRPSRLELPAGAEFCCHRRTANTVQSNLLVAILGALLQDGNIPKAAAAEWKEQY